MPLTPSQLKYARGVIEESLTDVCEIINGNPPQNSLIPCKLTQISPLAAWDNSASAFVTESTWEVILPVWAPIDPSDTIHIIVEGWYFLVKTVEAVTGESVYQRAMLTLDLVTEPARYILRGTGKGFLLTSDDRKIRI